MAGADALRRLVLALVPGIAEFGPGAERPGAAAVATTGQGCRQGSWGDLGDGVKNG